MHDLVLNNILSSIKTNAKTGNIAADDALQLKELTLQLYDHIYANYDKLGGYNNMKPLLDGAMELPLDKYRIKIDELEKDNASLSKEKADLEKKAQELELLLQQYKNKKK